MNGKEPDRYHRYRIRRIVTIRQIVTIHFLRDVRELSTNPHGHDFWELVYADRGCVEAMESGETRRLVPGEITFHRPGRTHWLRLGEKPSTALVLSFVCTGAAMKRFGRGVQRLEPEQKRLLTRMIDEIYDAFETDGSTMLLRELKPKAGALPGAEQLLCCFLEQLLIELLRRETEGAGPERRLLLEVPPEDAMAGEVRTYVAAHLTEKLTVEDIARGVQYSRSYLAARFRASAGMGVMEYVARTRVEAAKALLREGELSVTQISDRLGFGDVHYFSRRFRQLAGCAPTEYRASLECGLRRSFPDAPEHPNPHR